jgi:excisionase family DNA binding protein
MMSPHAPQHPIPGDDTLLTPREVAGLFGVRTTTIARWAREGKIDPIRTPGGHRRYRSADVRALLEAVEELKDQAVGDPEMVDDAVRLYAQGWGVRQVAARFECSYGAMRRILQRQGVLRPQGAPERPIPSAGPGSRRAPGPEGL